MYFNIKILEGNFHREGIWLRLGKGGYGFNIIRRDHLTRGKFNRKPFEELRYRFRFLKKEAWR